MFPSGEGLWYYSRMKQFLPFRGADRTTRPGKQLSAAIPLLQNGDCLTQPEFHRRYEAYPDDTKFELIGGIVYMASPQRLPHGKYSVKMARVLDHYTDETPGVETSHDTTTILGHATEPQPDLNLRIVEEYGGQSKVNDELYILFAPELLMEIAHSTVSIDMNQKREEYRKAGVVEYVVICIEEEQLHWFDFKANRELPADCNGIFRSRVFPGLWIDSKAVFVLNSRQLAKTLRKGLASEEHARFVKRLKSMRQQ